MSEILVNIGKGNGFSPGCTKPLPIPVCLMIYEILCQVVFEIYTFEITATPLRSKYRVWFIVLLA